MPNSDDRKPKKFQTFTRRIRGFIFFEDESSVTCELPSESPFPASPIQTSGVERESLRPSRPAAAGPGIVRGNVFHLRTAKKTA